jgi:hypothetical protein
VVIYLFNFGIRKNALQARAHVTAQSKGVNNKVF